MTERRFVVRPYMRRVERRALIASILDRHTEGGILDALAASITMQRELLLAPSTAKRYVLQRLHRVLA